MLFRECNEEELSLQVIGGLAMQQEWHAKHLALGLLKVFMKVCKFKNEAPSSLNPQSHSPSRGLNGANPLLSLDRLPRRSSARLLSLFGPISSASSSSGPRLSSQRWSCEPPLSTSSKGGRISVT